VHFVASPLAEGERNKVRGLRAAEYHFEMFKGTYRSPSLTLPLSFKKSEATPARGVRFIHLDVRIG